MLLLDMLRKRKRSHLRLIWPLALWFSGSIYIYISRIYPPKINGFPWFFFQPFKWSDMGPYLELVFRGPPCMLVFGGSTWRIIPVSKWLITMVNKSPKDRAMFPFQMDIHGLYSKWRCPYKSWKPILQVSETWLVKLWFVQHLKVNEIVAEGERNCRRCPWPTSPWISCFCWWFCAGWIDPFDPMGWKSSWNNPPF